MRKISFYILILIIFANLFTPFTISISKYTRVDIQKNIVNADDYQTKLQELKDSMRSARIAVAAYINNTVAADNAGLYRAATEAINKTIKIGNEVIKLASTPAQKDEINKISQDWNIEVNQMMAGHVSQNGDPPTNIGPQEGASDNNTYNLLAPLPGLEQVKTSNGIGDYLNIIFKVAIGLCGALAVIMIVIGGIQYMGNESVFGKTEAKGRILSAILGLLIALGAYAILYTINPDLTGQNGVTIDQVTADIEGDAQAPVTVNQQEVTSLGIMCPGSGGKQSIPSIAKSFAGRMTYSQEVPKGQTGPSGTIKLDCSGYVNYVLKCAGINNSRVNSGTGVIFASAEKVVDKSKTTDTSINGKALEIGDLVGWPPQDNKDGHGHVMIYIGDGQVVNDSHGGKTNGVLHAPGKAYGSFPLTKYKNNITYVKRIATI